MSKKLITKKQQSILILLYTFRFINSKQIQQFLQHKDHRRINSWLKDLEEKKFIQREFKPRYGVLTKPAVCSLTDSGKKYIQQTFKHIDKKYITRMRNDSNRSKALKARIQVLVDYCFIHFRGKEFIETCINMLDNGVKLQFNKFQFLSPAYYYGIDFILLTKLKPDGYITRNTKAGKTHSFIYVIDSYVPRLTLQYMLRKLFDVINDESWEDHKINSLHIYYVCPNNMVSIYLRKILANFLENYYYETPLLIHFATRNQLNRRLKKLSEKIGWQTISSEDSDY